MTKTNRKIRKTGSQKAGKIGNPKRPTTTVLFVPSTKGSLLIQSLKEEEDKMAENDDTQGVKYQEAGGNVLINSFDKVL